MNTNNMAVEELKEIIMNELHCTGCPSIIFGNILRCTEQHSFCTTCFENIDNCPKCQSPNHPIKGRGRRLALEKLCRVVEFDCKYRQAGCTVSEIIEDLPYHEKFCDFSTRRCVLDSCQWEGPFPDFLPHCKECHSKVIIEGVGVKEITEKNSDFIVFEYGTAFLLKFDSSGPTASVRHIWQPTKSKTYKFTLSIRDGNSESEADFKKFTGACLLPEEDSESSQSPFDIKLSSEGMTSILISIHEVETQRHGRTLDQKVIAILKCSDCPRPLRESIPQCVDGHDFCSECFEYMDDCLECRAPKGLSNKFLERVARMLLRPCAYAVHGCTHTGYDEYLKQHERYHCQYKPKYCLVSPDCPWRGNPKEWIEHCLELHEDYLRRETIDAYKLKAFKYERVEVHYESGLYHLFGKLFRFNFELNPTAGTFSAACYYFGDAIDEGRFSFIIWIQPSDIKCLNFPKLFGLCWPMPYDSALIEPYCVRTYYSGWPDMCGQNGEELLLSLEILDNELKT